MSMYRVPRTGLPMLKFFGDLIAKHESRFTNGDGRHEYAVKLFRTEAPGYVLAVDYRGEAGDHQWASHTPDREKVTDLFGQYAAARSLQGVAGELFREALQMVMLQSPELDQMVQWSSVMAGDH